MSRKDKISFIMTSRDTSHVYRDLKELHDIELDDLIRNIVKRLVIESKLIANMYISDVKIFPN